MFELMKRKRPCKAGYFCCCYCFVYKQFNDLIVFGIIIICHFVNTDENSNYFSVLHKCIKGKFRNIVSGIVIYEVICKQWSPFSFKKSKIQYFEASPNTGVLHDRSEMYLKYRSWVSEEVIGVLDGLNVFSLWTAHFISLPEVP